MQAVTTATLKPTASAPLALFDLTTGEQLIAAGAVITTGMIAALKKLGFNNLLTLDPDDTPATIRKAVSFQKLNLLTIEPGIVAAHDIYTTDGQFLIAEGTTLSESILASLSRRKIREVLIQREIPAARLEKVETFRALLRQLDTAPDNAPAITTDTIPDPSTLSPIVIARMARDMTEAGEMEVSFDTAESLANEMRDVDPFTPRQEQQKRQFINQYKKLSTMTESIFGLLRKRHTIKGKHLSEMCEELIRGLIEDRELLLGSIFLESGAKDYLSRHSLNVAILAVNIAAAHGYSQPMIAEVAYGALLADVGMLNVPDGIRFKTTPLTLSDVNEIKRHTVYGIDKLQCVDHLPKTTPLVAYQSHERLDGSGYPHGKRAGAIHDYAKIVAVADIYHAMIDKRPFRDTQNLPYAAMEHLLQMVATKKIDGRFVKSLLAAISLFPVGSWVRLNSGEIGRVIKADKAQFTMPVIVILFGPDNKPCPAQRVDLREESSRQIVEAVKSLDDNPMVGF